MRYYEGLDRNVMRRERKAEARKEAHSGECTAVYSPNVHTFDDKCVELCDQGGRG